MSIKTFNFTFIKILIVCLPFFLITGSFLSDLSCTLIGVLFLLHCSFTKNFKEYKNIFFFYFFLIFIYINLNSLLFSFDLKKSLETSFAFVRIILFFFALSFFFRKFNVLKKYFLFSFLFFILILLVDSLYQFFIGHNLLGVAPVDNSRITSFFSKQIMGSYVSRMLPLAIGICFLLNFKTKINLALIFICSILIILSGERLSFTYLFMFIIFYLIIDFNKKYFFYFISLFCLLFIFLFFYNSKNIDRIFLHTFHQLNEKRNTVTFLSYRHILHYETAYNMFLDKKLTGHGLKSFRYLCDDPKYSVSDKIVKDIKEIGKAVRSPIDGIINFTNKVKNNVSNVDVVLKSDSGEILDHIPASHTFYPLVVNGSYVSKGELIFYTYEFQNGCNTHPHNIYLQFLSELGFVGFALFVFMFFYIFFNLLLLIFKHFKKSISIKEKCMASILFGLFISMFPLFPSGNYFNNWLLIITYLPIGFYISLVNRND